MSAFKEASSGENSATLDAGRLRELVKFTLAAIRNTSTAAEGDKTKMAELWRAADWSDVLDALRRSDRFKNATGLTNALKQVVGLLGGGQNGAPPGAGDKTNKKEKRKAADEATELPVKKGKKMENSRAEQEVVVEVDERSPAHADASDAKLSKKEKKARKKASKSA